MKSHKKIFLYVTVKKLRYVKINSVNPLYLITNKINLYLEEINGNKYLTLVPTGETKEIMTGTKKLYT